MYEKNIKTQVLFVEENSKIEIPFINYYELKQFSPQTSLISQQIKIHLDKQTFTLHYQDNRRISQLIPFLNDHFGLPAKIRNKAGHRRRIALSKGNSRVVIYSEPSTHQDPIVVVLYGSARFEAHCVRKLLSGSFVIETCGSNCKSLSVKNTRNPEEILRKVCTGLTKDGYKLFTDTKQRNYYYLENLTWDAECFRVTLRFQPTQNNMAPAALQIDTFRPDEASYVDVVWLLKSIQFLDITVRPHEIEYQVIFPEADESIVLDLLRKVTLKNIRKSGYHNGTGKEIISYNVKTGLRELLNSTHYIGDYKSCIQTKIYKKPDNHPKLEFVLRRSFFSRIKCNDLEDLFNNNIWDFISNKVVFGSLDVDTSRRSKNRKHLEKALERSRTSLHWAKQELPANPYRHIQVDETFTKIVSSSFSELHDLLKYVWRTVEGEDSCSKVVSSEISENTAACNRPPTGRIFPELQHLQLVRDKGETPSPSSSTIQKLPLSKKPDDSRGGS
jgi:hypothetical protein